MTFNDRYEMKGVVENNAKYKYVKLISNVTDLLQFKNVWAVEKLPIIVDSLSWM